MHKTTATSHIVNALLLLSHDFSCGRYEVRDGIVLLRTNNAHFLDVLQHTHLGLLCSRYARKLFAVVDFIRKNKKEQTVKKSDLDLYVSFVSIKQRKLRLFGR